MQLLSSLIFTYTDKKTHSDVLWRLLFAIFKSWTYTLFDNMNQGYTRFILCCSVVLVLQFSELNELNNRTRRRCVIDFSMKPCNITWLLDGPLRVIKLQPRFKVFNISICMYYSIVPIVAYIQVYKPRKD